MISACFRLDDPSPVGDVEVERRILDIFARRQIPLCVATIPFARAADGSTIPLSRQNAGHLVAASRDGTIEIAQHGHLHLRATCNDRGAPSEFFGVPFEEQARLIAEGNALLSTLFERRVQGFVPPWNTYDRNTLQVLAKAGFDYLSAGPEGIKFGKLPVVPATCGLRHARRILERAWFYRALSPLVVVALHPDDFAEFKLPPLYDDTPPFTNLHELEALLDWIKASSWIRTETLGHIAESVRNGTPLCNPSRLKLPHRIKAQVPPILVRSGEWVTARGIFWGALRGRLRRRSVPSAP